MVEKICRLCFGKHFRPFDIFGKKGLRLNVAQLIRTHFPDEVSCKRTIRPTNVDSSISFSHVVSHCRQVTDDDILPKFLCNDCWPKLEQFHEFYNAVAEAKSVYLKNTVKEEVPHFVAINCDGIDFDDDRPSVKIEPLVVEAVKIEPAPIAEKRSECAANEHDAAHDNDSSDFFDSEKFVHCKMDSDSDADESAPKCKEELSAATECNPKIENAPVSVLRSTAKNIRKDRKKKTGLTNKAKAKCANKAAGNSATKSVILETDFQLASKYMRINCELCDHPFETLASARIHCRSKHNSTAKFTCCERRLRIYNINDHLQYHLNPDVYK